MRETKLFRQSFVTTTKEPYLFLRKKTCVYTTPFFFANGKTNDARIIRRACGTRRRRIVQRLYTLREHCEKYAQERHGRHPKR
jgi:hypothetical protein